MRYGGVLSLLGIYHDGTYGDALTGNTVKGSDTEQNSTYLLKKPPSDNLSGVFYGFYYLPSRSELAATRDGLVDGWSPAARQHHGEKRIPRAFAGPGSSCDSAAVGDNDGAPLTCSCGPAGGRPEAAIEFAVP